MSDGQTRRDEKNAGLSRRQFLKMSGGLAVIVGAGGSVRIQNGVAAYPVSEGYLLVDSKKCQGCLTCMLACSLAHEGEENLTLSRIQVMQDSFSKFPEDLDMAQCRQCVDPACVDVCPTGALSANARFGNVRMIDRTQCIGCGDCVEACPYTPSRPVVASDENFNDDLKSRKCDLCADTPYHWDDAGGGPGGKQACVEVCPVGAIKFSKEIPVQQGDSGYRVNLRTENWRKLGYSTN